MSGGGLSEWGLNHEVAFAQFLFFLEFLHGCMQSSCAMWGQCGCTSKDARDFDGGDASHILD